MKFASFDLEIAKDLPEDMDRWEDHAPLGITCAAVAYSDTGAVRYWTGVPQLNKSECIQLVHDLQDMVGNGYKLLTWNGAGFDLHVLAQESGMYKECGELALHHIDMMLFVTFRKGWYLSLQKALEGAGLEGKLKEVALSDGTILEDMSGAKAPKLWAAGEHKAVLAYLKEDVEQPLKLAMDIRDNKRISWTSNSGKRQYVTVGSMQTVRECFGIPEPDVSWMTNPPTRMQFIAWIPKEIVGVIHPARPSKDNYHINTEQSNGANDYDLAREHRKQVAENGDAENQFFFGGQHYKRQEYKDALPWFIKAANQGHSEAMFFLGAMYDNGRGVAQDSSAAFSWYLRAANCGHAKAQFNLWVMYENGRGVDQDSAQGAKWCYLSAEQGNDRAQFRIGEKYVLGLGVKQDYKQAYEWFRKAAEQGNVKAQEFMDQIYSYADNRGETIDFSNWWEELPEEWKAVLLPHLNGAAIDKVGEELWNITTLDLSGIAIGSFGPLKRFTKLKSLKLSGHRISDLQLLQEMTELESLFIDKTQITDLSPLSVLKNLNELDISNTGVVYFEPIGNLIKLKKLNISSTKGCDIKPLSNLSNLEVLSIASCPIDDLLPIKDLTNLRELNMQSANTYTQYNNIVIDLSYLHGLRNMRKLDLANINIESIECVNEMNDLQEIYCWSTNISDLKPLANKLKLDTVFISNTKVKEVNSLKNLNNLSALYLDGCLVQSLDPIASLTSISKISAKHLGISNCEDFRRKYPIPEKTDYERLYEKTELNNTHEISEYIFSQFPSWVKNPSTASTKDNSKSSAAKYAAAGAALAGALPVVGWISGAVVGGAYGWLQGSSPKSFAQEMKKCIYELRNVMDGNTRSWEEKIDTILKMTKETPFMHGFEKDKAKAALKISTDKFKGKCC